jgi:hypothetical protein
MDGQTYRQTSRPTDNKTDRQTDRQTRASGQRVGQMVGTHGSGGAGTKDWADGWDTRLGGHKAAGCWLLVGGAATPPV